MCRFRKQFNRFPISKFFVEKNVCLATPRPPVNFKSKIPTKNNSTSPTRFHHTTSKHTVRNFRKKNHTHTLYSLFLSPSCCFREKLNYLLLIGVQVSERALAGCAAAETPVVSKFGRPGKSRRDVPPMQEGKRTTTRRVTLHGDVTAPISPFLEKPRWLDENGGNSIWG